MHVRCPHCHQPVELVDNAGLEHIDCPSCGSHFSLLGEQTTDYRGGLARTIGHFELIERLGMGQFGAVWMARDTELDRTVAVKIPRQEQLSREDMDMFLREARAAAQLHHPNIVSVYEVGREGDTIFIVSDLVRGITLADRLTAGRMSPREAAQFCVTIAEALHHAHQAGVVHRDLKPSNIMLDAEDQPHLMDFGLAKREAGEITMTMDGRILGTPAYMSPEQARGEAHHADARSDIYSLGTILFELLTGELPFRGNKRMLLMQIIHDEPPSPRKLDAAVPRDLETICLKCLEKPPERRYATARDVADELRRYLAGEPIHARPVGRLERSWRWCRRNPVVAGLLTTTAATLLAGTIVSSYFALLAEKRAVLADEATTQAKDKAIEASNEAARANANAERADKSAKEAQANAATIAEQDAELRARLAQQYLERGAKLCAASELHSGMLWLTRAFDAAGAQHPAQLSARRLLAGWCAEPNLTLYHPAAVTRAEFAAGANRIVTSCADNTCFVWDASTGCLVAGPIKCKFGGHRVSPAGKFLVTLDETDTVPGFDTVHDLSTGENLWRHTVHPSSQFTAGDRVYVFGAHDGKHDRVHAADPKTGKDLCPPISLSGGLRTLVLDDRGKRAIIGEAAGAGERLSTLDLENGKAIGATIEISEKILGVQVNFERDRLLTRLNKDVRLWNLGEGAAVGGPVPSSHAGGAMLLKHGAVAIVTAPLYAGKVRFIDTQSGQEIAAVPFSRSVVDVGGRPTSPLTPVSLSPNEKLVAVQTGDTAAAIVDTSTGKPVCPDIALEGVLHLFTWSADSRLLATTCLERKPVPAAPRSGTAGPRYELRVWEAASGKRVGEAIHPTVIRDPATGISFSLFTAVEFTRDARRLVMSMRDRVLVWSVPPGEVPQQEFRSGRAFGPALFNAFVPQRDALLLSSNERTLQYRPVSFAQPADLSRQGTPSSPSTLREQIFGLKPVNGLALNPRGTRIYSASDDWTCRKWSVKTKLWMGTPLQHGDAVRAVAVSRDGLLVATGSADRSARLWDASKHTQVAGPLWHPQGVTSLAFFPDASCLVTGCEDGTARIWNCVSGMTIGRTLRHAKAVRSVSVSPDGSRILTASEDETARVWDTATGEPLCEPLRHESAVNVVQFSADGKRFLSASNVLHQWDARTAIEVNDPMDHGAKIACAAYSPNGEIVVTADENLKLRIWDAGCAQMAGPEVTLPYHIRDVAFEPQGEAFFTAGRDGQIRRWQVPAPFADEPDRLRAWVEVATTQNAATPQMERLSFATWSQRQQQLYMQGGPPSAEQLTMKTSWSSGNVSFAANSLRSQSEAAQQRLKTIGLAMARYHDARHAFPARASFSPSGQPLLSWRVHLLPFLEQQKLYDQFKLDEPWDSEHNRALGAEMPAAYRSPWTTTNDGKTCFVVPAGPGTCFDLKSGARIQDVIDGTSNTILVAAVNPEHAVIWTQPADLDLSTTDAVEALSGLVPGRCLVGLADGSAQFLPCGLPEEVFPRTAFMSYFTPRGGEFIPEIGDAVAIDRYRAVTQPALFGGGLHPLDEIRTAPQPTIHFPPGSTR